MELDSYFQPNSTATVILRNQYFIKSDGFVKSDRIRDFSLFAPNQRWPVSESIAWRAGMRVTSMFEGDGATKTFRLPYVKKTKHGAAR